MVADTRTEEEVLDLARACRDGKLLLVKQLATRFETGAADRRITAPAPPMRRYSNDDLDLPPIRVIETHANALSPAFVPV